MNFIKFLNQIRNTEKLEQKAICFTGDNYNFLFLIKFLNFLEEQKKLKVKLKTLIYESQEKTVFQSSLTQTFLGNKNFYWLGDWLFSWFN